MPARTFRNTYSLGNLLPFYNRTREINELSTRLKGEPTLTVLLGPPSSGKTALARQVTTQLRPDRTPEFHPLSINLRLADTSKHGTFLNAFLSQGFSKAVPEGFWNKWLSSLELSFGEASANPKNVFSEAAADVYRNLGENLRPWNSMHGERPPLLVIDEANSFKRMDDEAIQAFLDFAVHITKEENKMHVILTSSNSFFESWLKQRVNPIHFSTLVVGDLPQEEAHHVFLELVKNEPRLSEEQEKRLTNMDFNIVFKMTGGRIFYIQKYVSQVCCSGYFDNPMAFEPIINAYSIMEGDFLGKAKTYKKPEALAVAQLLIDSPGYIGYAELKEKLSDAAVKEMIERNFLHYRPSSTFSRDLIPSPSKPVLTAQSEPALRAMEALVKHFGK